MSDKLIPVDHSDSWTIILCTFDESLPRISSFPVVLNMLCSSYWCLILGKWAGCDGGAIVGETVTVALQAMIQSALHTWDIFHLFSPSLHSFSTSPVWILRQVLLEFRAKLFLLLLDHHSVAKLFFASWVPDAPRGWGVDVSRAVFQHVELTFTGSGASGCQWVDFPSTKPEDCTVHALSMLLWGTMHSLSVTELVLFNGSSWFLGSFSFWTVWGCYGHGGCPIVLQMFW